ncbi:hypothetical protein QO206_03220 [Leeuwenhoekiella aequorea]|uniref:hypothetical protein n=1 Tax=Leeuwenhoekiella aequorea TaxID=283736 RepID=UPI00352EB0B1|tara:strand:+ start:5852 stop:6235 length:384 start_codon:yes stop_codon:yes gene_type:complete
MSTQRHYAIENMIEAYMIRERWQNEAEYNGNTNTKTQEMETLSQHEIDENIRNFNRETNEILSAPYELKVKHDDEGLPYEAAIYTREELEFDQIEKLDLIALNWNLKLSLSTTDTRRLSINFKRIED